MTQKGLLLSAYAADSHRRWSNELQKHIDEVEWTELILPPRFFSWRFRGNALTWAVNHAEVLNREYDFVLATSMCDIATLKGLVPTLHQVPIIVYFHENQFVYPIQHKVVQREVFHFCMLNIYTALAADSILFNSEYNYQSLLTGVSKLIRKMPDHAPKKTYDLIKNKSRVLPVPLEDKLFTSAKSQNQKLSILWNHRWEYDKAPERFFAALFILKELNVDFDLHVVGQQFSKSPAIFALAEEQLQDHIKTWGYQESKEAYYKCIEQSNVVVSTALHEFQGVALLEAVAGKCFPLAPNRLVYPHILPQECLYHSYPDDRSKEAKALSDKLLLLSKYIPQKGPNIESYKWSNLVTEYRKTIAQAIATKSL